MLHLFYCTIYISSISLASSVQLSSVAQSCPALCNPMDCSTPGFPIHYPFPELTQTHLHWVSDAIQPSHPLSSPSPAFNLSQHQGLFFFFYYFNWRLITLQYCSGFCHVLAWISHGCTCVPHPELPSHFPPHPIHQGHPSTPTLSTLSHASNLDWWSISHMLIYMFQCYSLKSSHPSLLPQSPTVCSLPLCLFCCLTYSVMPKNAQTITQLHSSHTLVK